MTDSHPFHSRTRLGGCPGYVRGWCAKAREHTLQRGYRDVGYLLASNLRAFRPERFAPGTWAQRLGRLRRLLRKADESAVMEWFAETYPQLMRLIPVGDHPNFVAGLRDWQG